MSGIPRNNRPRGVVVPGTSYTLTGADYEQCLVFTSASPVAVTLSAPGTGGDLYGNWYCELFASGAGGVTVTPIAPRTAAFSTAPTINGASSLVIATGGSLSLFLGTDGNWYALSGALGLAGGLVNGNLSIPTNDAIYFNGLLSGTAARIHSDGSNLFINIPGGTGVLAVQNFNATVNAMILDDAGDLTIAGATATKPGSTSWVNPSARELKQDIQPYDQGLQAVLALNPVSYRYNGKAGLPTDESFVGLVYDETGHMPEMHRTVKLQDEDVDALDSSALVFALINAVKELTHRLEALEGKQP